MSHVIHKCQGLGESSWTCFLGLLPCAPKSIPCSQHLGNTLQRAGYESRRNCSSRKAAGCKPRDGVRLAINTLGDGLSSPSMQSIRTSQSLAFLTGLNSTLFVQVPTPSSSTSTTSPSFSHTCGFLPMPTPWGLQHNTWISDRIVTFGGAERKGGKNNTHVPVKITSPGISVVP